MKSKLYIYLFTFLFFSNAFAENIQIQAKNITLDKDKVTITNHNVIASSFILTDISTKLIFYSNDVSYNDIPDKSS